MNSISEKKLVRLAGDSGPRLSELFSCILEGTPVDAVTVDWLLFRGNCLQIAVVEIYSAIERINPQPLILPVRANVVAIHCES